MKPKDILVEAMEEIKFEEMDFSEVSPNNLDEEDYSSMIFTDLNNNNNNDNTQNAIQDRDFFVQNPIDIESHRHLFEVRFVD